MQGFGNTSIFGVHFVIRWCFFIILFTIGDATFRLLLLISDWIPMHVHWKAQLFTSVSDYELAVTQNHLTRVELYSDPDQVPSGP